MASKYLVTVCSTTFNMEPYIGPALESWLSQKTTFPYEILISDDGSTDNTCDVIRGYMKEHDNIRLISTGHIGKMPNFIRSLQESKSRYVALCDGDDYWIDPMKLQKQFDFMEANPDFEQCWTNSYVINETTGEKKVAKTHLWDVGTTKDLLKHRDDDNVQMSPGHTSTFFYRNQFLTKYPKWMYGDVMTDFPLYMLLSRYGKSKFINDFTAVYRHRVNGVSSVNFNRERAIRRRIFVYQHVNRDYLYRYAGQINPIIADYYFSLGKFLYKTHRKIDGVKAVALACVYNPGIPFHFIACKNKHE